MVSAIAQRWLSVLDGMEAGDFDLLDTIAHETLSLDGVTMQRDALKSMVRAYYQSGDGLKTTVLNVFEDSDVVMARATFSGAFLQDYVDPILGLIPGSAGRQFKVPMMAIRRFRDGRISEMWDQSDRFSMLRQLGAFGSAAS